MLPRLENLSKDEEDVVVAKSPAEIETPVAFVPQNLPTTATNTDFPSSALKDTKASSHIR